ncbi:hypothetical protein SAVIM40S_02035 [Streptomyces avidinii]
MPAKPPAKAPATPPTTAARRLMTVAAATLIAAAAAPATLAYAFPSATVSPPLSPRAAGSRSMSRAAERRSPGSRRPPSARSG